jgi:hypothetical protein
MQVWKPYGKLGLLVIIAAEILLIFRVRPVTIYFTPIVWSGYIILVDSLIYSIRGTSLLTSRFRQFLALLLLSIGFWYIFEFYNLFINNWHYVGLPESKIWRYLGYFWSFATIWPAILLTCELIIALGIFSSSRVYISRKASPVLLAASMILGALFLIWPAPLWVGFLLLLEPINYRWGERSILKDWLAGKRETLYALLVSGLVCGILWEFWNYWAEAKWEYSVPIAGNFKLFEMPVLGYLGFPTFACEVYAMYNFATGLWHKLTGQVGVGTNRSPDGVKI